MLEILCIRQAGTYIYFFDVQFEIFTSFFTFVKSVQRNVKAYLLSVCERNDVILSIKVSV